MEPLVIENNPRQEASCFLQREWLCTNGLGGYASGTLQGVNTRRDHGIFVPQAGAPWGRVVMLANLVEEIRSKEAGATLGGFESTSGALSSDAHKVLKEFRLEYLVPVWIFQIGGTILEKKILMSCRSNVVWVQYRLLKGDEVNLALKPFVTFRTHDHPFIEPKDIKMSFKEIDHGIEINPSRFDYPLQLRFFGREAMVKHDEKWVRNIFYRSEHERGEPDTDTLLNVGEIVFSLDVDFPLLLGIGFNCPDSRAGDFENLFLREHVMRLLETPLLKQRHSCSLIERLTLAADQFVINKTRGIHMTPEDHEKYSVIAGYHWFLDWGRDSMISLEGLTLCTGRFEAAKAILTTLSRYVKDGLLFNCFAEGEAIPSYSAADATLWFFHALQRYCYYTHDSRTLEELFPLAKSFINAYWDGSAQGIKADPADGLISAVSDQYPLTWMDAQMPGKIFTPRSGKPVEIQALWFNALQLMSQWAKELGYSESRWSRMAEQVRKSFNAKFWNEAGGFLFDVIDNKDQKDASLRPNQLLAISLDYPVLDSSRWKSVVDVVQRKLLTEYGLRTLSVEDPAYHGHYIGSRYDRDSAYHQGAVWPWLLGPFIDAWLKVYPDKKKARAFLLKFDKHLTQAGIGSISEIFDGDSPRSPRGCVAQAWSVAEILRVSIAVNQKGREKSAPGGNQLCY